MLFPQLSALLREVHEIHGSSQESRIQTLQDLLVKKHYWPYLQVKYFSNQSPLVLLHNVYRQGMPIANQELYDECRSVVLNMDANEGENIVMSLSKKIPVLSDSSTEMPDVELYEVGYEGTMLYMYFYNNRWYISTSTCPSVDRSKYFHPTKTHGDMLNDVLASYFPEIQLSTSEENNYNAMREYRHALRSKFFEYLDPTKTYRFQLVHYENGYIMDYTQQLGEQYKVLFHLGTMDRVEMKDCYDVQENLHILGVKYTLKFNDLDQALNHLNAHSDTYSILAHSSSKLYKIVNEHVREKEEQQNSHPNPWMNLLWTYLLNKPNYKMEDYIRAFPNEEWTVNHLHAPRIVAKVITFIRDMLYSMYRSTTYYYIQTNTYRMNHELDRVLPKIHRFHMAQLRHLQITYHVGKPLNRQMIHEYLCKYQTIKNIRMLIDSFMTNDHMALIDPVTRECFQILNEKLKKRYDPLVNISRLSSQIA